MLGHIGRKRTIVAVLALGLVPACSNLPFGGGPGYDVVDDLPPETIFERGEFELEQGRGENAAFYFGEVERLYPYSELSQRALIMTAFAYHRDQDYENSRAAAQRYLDFYPASEDAAYAAYLLALECQL